MQMPAIKYAATKEGMPSDGTTNKSRIETRRPKIPEVSVTACPMSIIRRVSDEARGCLAMASAAFPAAYPSLTPHPDAPIATARAAPKYFATRIQSTGQFSEMATAIYVMESMVNTNA